MFSVGQMFDDTIHLLVKPRNYRQIKEEIKEQIPFLVSFSVAPEEG